MAPPNDGSAQLAQALSLSPSQLDFLNNITFAVPPQAGLRTDAAAAQANQQVQPLAGDTSAQFGAAEAAQPNLRLAGLAPDAAPADQTAAANAPAVSQAADSAAVSQFAQNYDAANVLASSYDAWESGLNPANASGDAAPTDAGASAVSTDNGGGGGDGGVDLGALLDEIAMMDGDGGDDDWWSDWGDQDGPVVLDMTGNGVKVTPLGQSGAFAPMANDGYLQRTAWAGAGNAILFYDPNKTGQITQANQVDFQLWDPTAKTDMQALEDVFDTNHDGVLNASDAAFAQFKVMVTNANGTTSVMTLAQAGITSINLNANHFTQTLADGSQIQGETTFTINGATHTAATVSLANDGGNYSVNTTTAQNASGANVVDEKAYNSDGSLAEEIVTTTSANGLSKTTTFDWNGDGVVDQTQTDNIVVNGVTTTETLQNVNGSGVLLDQTVTTTVVANGVTTRTIDTDPTGAGYWSSQEVVTTNADGSTSDAVSNLTRNGTLISETVSSVSANGLINTTNFDYDGRTSNGAPVFDLTTVDSTVVNADGSRTETLTDTNNNGSLRDETITITSANGLSKTTEVDSNGALNNGAPVFDLTTVATTVINADNSRTTTSIDTANNGTVIDETMTTVSANGFTITTQSDPNGAMSGGAPVLFTTTVDQSVFDASSDKTETITTTAANGTTTAKTIQYTGANGTTHATYDYVNHGSGLVETQSETVAVGANGSTGDAVASFAPNGTEINQTATTTSADRSSTVVQTDVNGDGVFDRTTVTTIVKNANGSSTRTTADYNGAQTVLLDKQAVTTSANGLTVTTQVDPDGHGVFQMTTVDATVNNADGSKTETITTTAPNAAQLVQQTIATSADRSTVTTTTYNADAQKTQVETVQTAPTGVTTDTVVNYAPNGSMLSESVTTTSANGLSVTTQQDTNGAVSAGGAPVFDATTNDVTVLNLDGSKTETVSNYAGTSLASETVKTTSATGLSIKTQQDTNGAFNAGGAPVFDLTTTDVTVVNSDGSRTETVAKFNSNNVEINATATTTSANGLSVTTQTDLNGDGIYDRTRTDVAVLNADGSKTETVADYAGANSSGTLLDRTVIATGADGTTQTIDRDTTGSGFFNQIETIATAANGSTVDASAIYAGNGALVSETVTTTAANGLSKIVQTDANGVLNNGAPVFNLTDSQTTTYNVDGSTTVVTANYAGSSLINQTTVTTSADGLTVTTATDPSGAGVAARTTVDATVLNADGSKVETVSTRASNNNLLSQSQTTTSADGKTISINHYLDGATNAYQTETIALQADGSKIDTLTDLTSTGTVKDTRVTTTSANGLSTTEVVAVAGTVTETVIDATVINADGSQTETQTYYRGAASGTPAAQTVTTTSANGLTKSTTWIGANGQGSIAGAATDVTAVNADGSTTETVSDFSPTGAQLDQSVTTRAAAGLTTTIQTSLGGATISSDTKVQNLNGSTSETLIQYNTNGTLKQEDVLTTSANGLTQTLQRDTNGAVSSGGAPIFNHIETTATNIDGSTTDTISDFNATGALIDEIVTTTSANGLTKTIQMDTTGQLTSGGAPIFNSSQTTATVLNADGSQTTTLSDYNPNGSLRDRTITTVSANGLTKTSQIDVNGDGVIDETQTDTTVLNADGSKTETITDTYASGTQKDQTVVATSADGLTVTTTLKLNGASTPTQQIVAVTNADGSQTNTTSWYNTSGAIALTQTATTSFDGLVTTVQRSNGVTETTSDLPNASGSYSWSLSAAITNPQGASATAVLQEASHSIDANGLDTWTYNGAVTQWTPQTTSTTNLFYLWLGGSTWAWVPVSSSSTSYTLTTNAPQSIIVSTAVEAQDETIAARLYDTLLGRAMTTSETQLLAKYVMTGSGALNETQLATDLAASAEFTAKYGSLTNTQFIERIFQNALGRSANLSELSTDLAALASGSLTQAALAVQVSDNAEHIADGDVYQTTNNTYNVSGAYTLDHTTDQAIASALIANIYAAALGQAPSSANLTTYSTDIVNGSMTASQVAAALIATSQFSSQYGSMSTNDFVSQIFVNALGRAPTAAESQFWASELTSGAISQADFVAAIAQSPDHLSTQDQQTTSVSVSGTGNLIHASGLPINFAVGASGTVDETGTASPINLTSNDSLTVTGTASQINVVGTQNTVSATGSTLALATNASAALTGNNDTATLATGANFTATGTGLTINAVTNSSAGFGAASAATVNGSGASIGLTSNDTVTVTGTGDTVNISGTGGTVTISGGSTVFGVGASASVSGNSDAISLGTNSTLTLSGSSDTINVTGTATTINASSASISLASGSSTTVNGNADTVILTSNGALTISGTPGAISINGVGNTVNVSGAVLTLAASASATVSGSSDTVTTAAGSNLSLTGANETVNVAAGATVSVTGGYTQQVVVGWFWYWGYWPIWGTQNLSNNINGSSATIMIGAGSLANVSGSNDAITIAGGATVSISGTGDNATITGTGSSVSASSDSISIASGASTTITGNSDTIALASNGTLTLSGSSDAINVSGAGNTITATSEVVNLGASAGATVSGNSDAIAVSSADTLNLSGSSDTVAVAGAGNVVSGSGETFNLAAGAGATINGASDTISGGAGSNIAANGGSVTQTQVLAGGGYGYWQTYGSTYGVYSQYIYVAPVYATVTNDTSNKIAASNSTIGIGANSYASVTGSNDTISIGNTSTANATGSNDAFVFHAGFGQDTVGGFNSTDSIQFDKSVVSNWATVLADAKQSGSNTVISVDAADAITLNNVAVTSLNQNQFHYV